MNKIFRKIRLKSLKESKNISYIKYAFGEILLVVIGILLALQINNWNENRKQDRELKNILKTIYEDLKTDTIQAKIIIDYYKEVEKNSNKIINNEINTTNFDDYPNIKALASRYLPFTIQTKGFEMVKNFNAKNDIQNDSIFIVVSQFYSPFIQLFDDSNEFIKNDVFKNIETYKKYDWFIDWSQNNPNNEMIDYFIKSNEFKIQVAAHNLLAVKNHLRFVTGYRDRALEIMKLIENQLNISN
ncbi:DUF6090 family protein [Polaribacter sp.]|uniref:DUF6090 family protein n=1 Tax=Polaribacter sp. TaxID=1920175 RepID=UPI00404847DC